MLAGTPVVHGQAVSSMSTSAETPARIEQSEGRVTRENAVEIARSKDFGLNSEEWARYRGLMRGPLGIYSPNLDPLTALGIEARSPEERRHIAELQVRLEARRAEKTLAYQRAYDDAWKRVYPGMQAVRTEPARTPDGPFSAPRGDSRIAVFVRENCPACDARVKALQASGDAFDVYVVGTQQDDARIRQWAHSAGIDANKVRAGQITLNHDAGRWLSLGQPGALPAVLRAVDGQWQRQ
jgi:integrating conjugative element protein (TIGR03759 family)